MTSGIEDLLVSKTTGSGWEGYLREQYTSLPETDDRILCTVVTASWDYAADADYDAAWEAARDAILSTFGDHYSPSVQYTLLRLGEAVLEAVPEIERVRFSLPNRHHLLFDLSRFGLENDHEIFHATTEPYGLIEGTVERSAVHAGFEPGACRHRLDSLHGRHRRFDLRHRPRARRQGGGAEAGDGGLGHQGPRAARDRGRAGGAYGRDPRGERAAISRPGASPGSRRR